MCKINFRLYALLTTILFFITGATTSDRVEIAKRIEILFLGHKSKHHDSERLADILTKEYFKQGINISYSVNPDDLNEKTLAQYDGLILYADRKSTRLNSSHRT